MTRRLGYAAALALLMVPALTSSEALAQRRGRPPADTGTQLPPPPAQEKTFPFGASWSVVTLNGKPASDRRATFQVDANLRGTGFGGCNTFSASAYPLREQGFAVGPIALTKRACDKGLNDFERSFLTALRAAQKWDLVEGKLVIRGGAGEVRLDRAL
jgi:heat shock protein HslJ